MSRARSWPWHGWVGLALVAIGQWLILARPPVWGEWYFPFVWYGFLLTADALNARVGAGSLARERPGEFATMVLLGAAFWWIFEGYNLAIQNWHYLGAQKFTPLEYFLVASLDFGVVLLAIWLVARLLLQVLGWRGLSWRRVPRPSRRACYLLVVAGIVAAILPLVAPRYAFPLTWVGIPLALDPLNYLRGRPSILGQLVRGRWGVPLALMLAGPVTGLFWEFWNYWAYPKWYYTVPFFDLWHLFEMPLPGYGGYVPFALELYALYHAVRGFLPGEPALIDLSERESESEGAML